MEWEMGKTKDDDLEGDSEDEREEREDVKKFDLGLFDAKLIEGEPKWSRRRNEKQGEGAIEQVYWFFLSSGGE